MNSEFVLSQGAGHKLELAVRRNGGTAEDVEWLSTEENFSAVELLRTGKASLFLHTKQVMQVVKTKPSILEFVSTVVVPATTVNLVAKEKFVRDTGRKAKVKISYLGDNFTEWFLSGSGKTEDPITEQTLRYHELRQSSVDGPIIAELGGAEKSETSLSEMFALMEKQGKGENGVLLNNSYVNIFYIKDQNGVLRAVGVFWRDDCWYVNANSVEDPYRWRDGYQVFSRNSVLESSEPSAPVQA